MDFSVNRHEYDRLLGTFFILKPTKKTANFSIVVYSLGWEKPSIV